MIPAQRATFALDGVSPKSIGSSGTCGERANGGRHRGRHRGAGKGGHAESQFRRLTPLLWRPDLSSPDERHRASAGRDRETLRSVGPPSRERGYTRAPVRFHRP